MTHKTVTAVLALLVLLVGLTGCIPTPLDTPAQSSAPTFHHEETSNHAEPHPETEAVHHDKSAEQPRHTESAHHEESHH